jgi:hypothetical protein
MIETGRRWVWRAAMVLGLLAAVVPMVTTLWPTVVGGLTGSATASREAPCLPGRAVPLMNSPHISWTAAATVTYNSTPPTSGPHFGFTLATGVYDTEIPDGFTVHALEHGHIAIQYAPDVTPPTVAALISLAKRHSAELILAPYQRLEHGIALTAWGRIDLLDGFDEARIERFVETFQGRYHHGWTRPDPC